MHYKIYIPGCRGYSPDHLKRVGLGELVERDCPITGVDVLQGGPDQGHGVVFSWAGDPDPVYQLDRQLWTACRPRGELADGRFWMGQTIGDPPRPQELLREKHLGGTLVELADGRRWMIPNMRLLPHQYDLDERGAPVRTVKSEYQAWVERGQQYFDLLLQWRQNQGGDLTVPDAWTFAIETLAMNYRVNADIVAWLGLLDDVSILALIGGVFEISALDQITAQKKTADLATQGT